ncbi:hypothetical protein HYU18_03590 [Candidatus Woesearchaeota archaeon]|nr:hypothetical protein [Candidatus Woesearchaeota archaeon]
MKYNATIFVDSEGGLISKVFAAEDRNIKGKASYKLEKTANGAKFSIDAEDSIALRTALNSITKILTVIEKIKKV